MKHQTGSGGPRETCLFFSEGVKDLKQSKMKTLSVAVAAAVLLVAVCFQENSADPVPQVRRTWTTAALRFLLLWFFLL